MRFLILFSAFALIAASAMAVSVTVAPGTGVAGTAVTDSIADALTQINAGGDAANTITLRSTEGNHLPGVDAIWAPAATKSVDFVAESGLPIIELADSTGRYMLAVAPVSDEAVITFTNIAFIPPIGLSYGNNVDDGINFANGSIVLTDCIFSANDGAGGVLSADAASADMVGGNNVGDDWMQFNTTGPATLTGCAISGSWDDAILIGGGPGVTETTTLDGGTVIANTGGAGIQVFGTYTDLVLDGSAGRVLIADTGRRGAADVGIKYFASTGTALTLNQADVVNSTNGLVTDFTGILQIDLTDARLAFGNTGGVGAPSQGNIALNGGAVGEVVNLTRVTVHDAGNNLPADAEPAGIAVGASPTPVWTIVDSIFSGQDDTFSMLGAGGSVTISTSAVVVSGPDAVAALGDLGAGQLGNDPIYASTSYTIGIAQDNPNFLLPQNPAYAAAASGGTDLVGGSPGTFVSVPVELSVFSSN